MTVPWNKLVKFHKEIVKLSEDDFFKLPANNNDNDRWSGIKGFNESPFSEVFFLNPTNLINEEFILNFQNEDLETVFLGYLFFYDFKKDRNQNWLISLVPIFFKEVKVITNDSEFTLTPLSNEWQLSSIFVKKIQQQYDISQDDLEKFIKDSFQKYEIENKLEFDIFIKNELKDKFPEVFDKILRSISRPNTFQSNLLNIKFVLFKSLSHGSINLHLIKDYNQLEKLSESEGTNYGGLNILSREMKKIEGERSIKDFIPLNEEQKRSVISALNDKLTVISGPPGTGKSQTVLSILLNAWSNGKSALFVSNNRQAVNVVYNRILKLQDENSFRLAIKANKNRDDNAGQDIIGIIDDVISKVAHIKIQNTSLKTLESNLENLIQEKEKLLNSSTNLNTKLIYESLNESKQSYKISIEKQIEHDNLIKKTETLIGEYFLDTNIHDYEKCFLNYKYWLEQIPELKNKNKQNINQIEFLESEKNVLLESLNHNLLKIGYISQSEKPRLQLDLLIKDFNNWLNNFREILIDNQTTESISFEENVSLNQKWSDLNDLMDWIELSEKLEAECMNFVQFHKENILNFNILTSMYNNECAILHDKDLYDIKNLSDNVLNKWLGHYENLKISKKPILNFFNTSEYYKNDKNLINLEGMIFKLLNDDLKNRVAINKIIDREELFLILNHIRNFRTTRDNLKNFDSVLEQIKRDFNEIINKISNGRYRRLKIESLPNDFYFDSIDNFIESLLIERKDVKSYKNYFENKEKKKNIEEKISKCFNSLENLTHNYKILKDWSNSFGKDQFGLFEIIKYDLSLTNFSNFKTQFDFEYFDSFITSCKKAREYELDVQAKNEEIKKLKMDNDSQFLAWMKGKPKQILLKIELNDFPNEEHFLFNVLEKLYALLDEVKNGKEILINIKKEIQYFHNESRESLKKAIRFMMDIEPDADLSILSKSIEDINYKLDFTELDKKFNKYDFDRIHDKVSEIENQICKKNVELTKLKYYNIISSDVELQQKLIQLKQNYNNNTTISEANYQLFKDCLPVLPIWITNAHQSQSIPLITELFDLVIIDEASQCNLTNFLPFVFRGKQLVIIGDKKQLPSISNINKSSEQFLRTQFNLDDFKEFNYYSHVNNSLYDIGESFLPNLSEVVNLSDHYRSNPLIIGFSNKHVYGKLLKLKKRIKNPLNLPLAWGVYPHPVNDSTCERGENGKSWYNQKECDEVIKIIQDVQNAPDIRNYSIGIITPFTAQEDLLKREINSKFPSDVSNKIKIGSVHKFQGDEKDIIIFSIVATNNMPDYSLSFIENPENLINVAATRAREGLFLVANYDLLKNRNTILGELIRYSEKINELRKPANQYNPSNEELILFSLMVIQGWDISVHQYIQEIGIEVDFIIFNGSNKTVIEVDGLQHIYQIEEDNLRDNLLKASGYNVYRVPARKVMDSPSLIINEISKLTGLNAPISIL